MIAIATSVLSLNLGVSMQAPASSRAAVPLMQATGLKQVRPWPANRRDCIYSFWRVLEMHAPCRGRPRTVAP